MPLYDRLRQLACDPQITELVSPENLERTRRRIEAELREQFGEHFTDNMAEGAVMAERMLDEIRAQAGLPRREETRRSEIMRIATERSAQDIEAQEDRHFMRVINDLHNDQTDALAYTLGAQPRQASECMNPQEFEVHDRRDGTWAEVAQRLRQEVDTWRRDPQPITVVPIEAAQREVQFATLTRQLQERIAAASGVPRHMLIFDAEPAPEQPTAKPSPALPARQEKAPDFTARRLVEID